MILWLETGQELPCNDPESQQECIARFQRDVDYFESHYEQLLREHPEQWVAIFNQAVVGTDSDFDALLETLDQAGIPIESALIERVTSEEDILILPT